MSVTQELLGGRYRLVSVIASGGMGVVWEAWDERLERPVAIKQLRALPGVPEEEAEVAKVRAIREARITAKLHHRHAVPVFDAVEHEGQPCLVMQLLPSTTLSVLLSESGPMPVSQVARIGTEIASALAAAHKLGIVHRDVKPGNILITADGAAHISDFGISHAMGDATLTHTGMIHGTPAYLAPEVARGEGASFPADVFSLGSTLYAAVEGAPPFGSDGNALALLHKVAAANVPPPIRAGELTPLLLEMLSSDPASRPTMETVAMSLADLQTDVQPDQETPTTAHAVPPAAARPDEEAAATLTAELEPESDHDESDHDESDHDTDPPPEQQAHQALAPDPPSEDTVAAPKETTAQDRSRALSRAPVVLGAAVAVALFLLLATTLTDNLGRDSSEVDQSTAAQSTPTNPPPTPTTSEQSDEPTAPATEPEAEPESPVQPLAEAESEPEPSAEPTEDPPAPERATQLTSAIADYYALLPDGTDEAWPRMTADYQTNHAGGMGSYESFWNNVNDVSVSNIEATPPDQVVATLTYSYDGRVDVERTRFRLVEEGGILKIAASEVLSSRSG